MARGSLEDRSLAFAESALEGRETPAQEYARKILAEAVRISTGNESDEVIAEARRETEAMIIRDMEYLRAMLAAAFHAGHVAGTEDHTRRGARR